jgi:phage-related baseplate assembly protein
MSNEFITTDADLIFEEIITKLEAGVSEPLYPGDERRIFGEALVPLFVAMYNAMNDAARQKMLRYARGEVLDALGERVGVERLAPTEATTVLRFALDSAITENVIIPKGTRATSDNARYFATTRTAVIEAGQLYVDVEAVSEGGGTQFNNIAVGALNVLVDLIAYVDTVSNIEVTAGGADEEDDDNLRERIRVAPSKLSTAGPVNGYRYWAMSADSSIADVRVKSEYETITRMLPVCEYFAYKGGSDLIAESLVVYEGENNDSPATAGIDYKATYEDDLLTIELLPNGSLLDRNDHFLKISIDKTNEGVVKIVPICENGELPDETILDKVFAACSASEVRPLTDRVVVEAPEVHEYDIDLVYYTTPATEGTCIQTVEGEGGAIDQFITWQAGALGRHINPDKLRALILAPTGDAAVGATRVVITSPEFAELNDTTIARFRGTKTIRHEVSG